MIDEQTTDEQFRPAWYSNILLHLKDILKVDCKIEEHVTNG